MKKILILFICILGFSSCMKKEDLFDPDRVQEEAKKNFPVQDVDPDHDWNMMGIAAISVSLNQGTGETYTIKVYTADPFDETSNATLSKKVSLQDGQNSILSVDLPKALEYVYVVREDSKYNRSMKPVKLIDGKGEVFFGVQTQKRSLSSRSVTGVTYPDVLSNASVEAVFKTPTTDELKKMTSLETTNDIWKLPNNSIRLVNNSQYKEINLGGKTNITLYVTEEVELKSFAFGSDAKIHVLNGGGISMSSFDLNGNVKFIIHEGGKLSVKSELKISNATLYNRGEITTRTGSAQVNLLDKACVYNDGDFFDDTKGSLTIAAFGCFFLNASDGDVELTDLTLNGNGTFVNESDGEVSVKNETLVNGTWVNAGSYETNKFKYTGSYFVRNDCMLKVDDAFRMETASGAKFLMNGKSTMYCKQMFLDQATIELGSKAYIRVENNIHFTDGNRIVGVGDANALLYVDNNNVINSGNPNKPIIYGGNLFVAAAHDKKVKFELEGNAEIISKEQVKILDDDNDCATEFDTEGGGTKPEDKISVYTFAFEDSSTSGGDYDFNDVVLKVETVPTDGKLKVKLVAAGAVKDLKVFYDGKALFGGKEVHEAMGCPSGVMINTGGVTGQEAVDEISWPDSYTIKQKGDFYIYDVKAQMNVKLPHFDTGFKPGYVPYAIVVPEDWTYPTEGQKVNKKYPAFDEWAKDVTKELEWYK